MATCLSTEDIYTDVQSLYSQMEEENLDDGEFASLLLLRSATPVFPHLPVSLC